MGDWFVKLVAAVAAAWLLIPVQVGGQAALPGPAHAPRGAGAKTWLAERAKLPPVHSAAPA